MERKAGSSRVAEKELQGALEKARTLSAEEERVLRMRHGAGVADLQAPLPRAAAGHAQLEDELLVIEMQLLRAMRARTGQTATASRPAPAASPRVTEGAVNRTKDKIVRALRKKK